MSDTNKQEVITDLDASFFQSYAAKMKKDAEKKQSGNFTAKTYDEIGYVGLEVGNNKFLRLIGAPPGAETMGYVRKNYDPKKIMMCDVKDDSGKKFQIRLPLREDVPAHNHILHRLYDKVMEIVWVNKKKIYVNESKHPELWTAVTKGGYTQEADGKGYSIAAGYKSTTYTIMNVIDRQDNWCAENKSTKILCRDIGIGKDGTVWPKPGIKSFGFDKRIADLVGKYGNMETFDVAIMRTGEKDPPLELKNASLYKQKDMMEELKNSDGNLPDGNLIVIGPLTAEEKAYKRYDLDKLYQPTSYTKLLKRIPSLFKLCDATLGTKFYEELEGLSVKEKEEWARLYPKEDIAAIEAEQEEAENKAIKEEVKKEEPPKRRTAVGPIEKLSDEKIAYLKGWAKLSDKEKSLIKDIKVKDGKLIEVVYEDCEETKSLYACDCGLGSPECFSVCPGCGASFIDSN